VIRGQGWLSHRSEGCIPGGQLPWTLDAWNRFSHCVRIEATPPGLEPIRRLALERSVHRATSPGSRGRTPLSARHAIDPFPIWRPDFSNAAPIWVMIAAGATTSPGDSTSHFSPLIFEDYDVFKKFSRSCLPTEVMIDSG
jgi:hypothetical protein